MYITIHIDVEDDKLNTFLTIVSNLKYDIAMNEFMKTL